MYKKTTLIPYAALGTLSPLPTTFYNGDAAFPGYGQTAPGQPSRMIVCTPKGSPLTTVASTCVSKQVSFFVRLSCYSFIVDSNLPISVGQSGTPSTCRPGATP